MTAPTDLNAQIAQRLFGWTRGPCTSRCMRISVFKENWHDSEGMCHLGRVPAYTTDPTATAEVWQWVAEALRKEDLQSGEITFTLRPDEGIVTCSLGCYEFYGVGATWPEALCRAALVMEATNRMDQEEDPRNPLARRIPHANPYPSRGTDAGALCAKA